MRRPGRRALEALASNAGKVTIPRGRTGNNANRISRILTVPQEVLPWTLITLPRPTLLGLQDITFHIQALLPQDIQLPRMLLKPQE